MRRIWTLATIGAGGALAVGFTPAPPATAAPPGYVYYFRSFGDWSVICGRDEPTRRDACSLSAPPPEIHGAESKLEIVDAAEGATVTMRVHGSVMANSPVYLRIDANGPHQAAPDQTGNGSWSGAEAETIIRELGAGQRAVMRSFGGPPPAPHDEYLSLSGFSAALADYRSKVSGGPVSQAPPPMTLPPPASPPAESAQESTPGSPPETPPASPPASAAPPAQVTTHTEAPKLIPPVHRETSAEGGANGSQIFDDRVVRAQLASNIVNREPVDELSSPVQAPTSGRDKIYFFTELRDSSGQSIVHRWEHNGQVVASIPFRIGSDRWRVYSAKTLVPDHDGNWTVSVVASDGSILAKESFVVQ